MRLGFEVGYTILSQWEQERDALAEEKKMIAEIGLANLTNQKEGGEGGGRGNKLSEETKKKIGLGNKGKIRSEETKKKLSLSRKGRIITEETKRKLSEATRVYWQKVEKQDRGLRFWSKEQTKAISRGGRLGYRHTEEVKRKISVTSKNRRLTEEQKAHLRRINLGKTINEATRKKLSVALQGRIVSDETRKKLSENKKLYYQKVHLVQAREKFIAVLQQIAA